ncbi:4Fe-4S cluster-binding domain-containing protein [Spiroplasma endosymbiont of Atherix ibis]|uniref:4Fe-4S cluster-binding domain-containing protein n=1 Tax=Spiroplasma endosymbiont of Atherix ibis TaxID=3066291 RepID=UPI0030CA9AA6
MANLNIGKFLMNSEIEGPGIRFVIWFQGCNIGCRGCSNQELLPLEKNVYAKWIYLWENIRSKEKI